MSENNINSINNTNTPISAMQNQIITIEERLNELENLEDIRQSEKLKTEKKKFEFTMSPGGAVINNINNFLAIHYQEVFYFIFIWLSIVTIITFNNFIKLRDKKPK